jgi:hypothetical protein
MLGGTFLNLIKIKSRMLILTPENTAVIHKFTGTKYIRRKKTITAATTTKSKNGRAMGKGI